MLIGPKYLIEGGIIEERNLTGREIHIQAPYLPKEGEKLVVVAPKNDAKLKGKVVRVKEDESGTATFLVAVDGPWGS